MDGIVKSMDMKLRFPDASLRFIPRHCDVRPSTPCMMILDSCLYEQLLVVKSSLSSVLLWQTDYA